MRGPSGWLIKLTVEEVAEMVFLRSLLGRAVVNALALATLAIC
jgi:hypothetical protein